MHLARESFVQVIENSSYGVTNYGYSTVLHDQNYFLITLESSTFNLFLLM